MVALESKKTERKAEELLNFGEVLKDYRFGLLGLIDFAKLLLSFYSLFHCTSLATWFFLAFGDVFIVHALSSVSGSQGTF